MNKENHQIKEPQSVCCLVIDERVNIADIQDSTTAETTTIQIIATKLMKVTFGSDLCFTMFTQVLTLTLFHILFFSQLLLLLPVLIEFAIL